MQIQGYFDLRFEAVRDAFAALFDNPGERGAALCVQIAGETVVDLWAGPADKDGQEMWQQDTLLNLFSCTKTFAAVAAHVVPVRRAMRVDPARTLRAD